MVKDVFGREFEIGDTIVCFSCKEKNICVEKVIGFWGKDGYTIQSLEKN